jgi:pre-mRNA-processing factor 19
MFCALSGVAPEEPVVSRKSGHVFERRLIAKYLAGSGGKCPMTGADLSEDDLIAVQLSGDVARPAPASAVSLPGLLSHMQAEWDAVALETHSVKLALSAAHQELAGALYKYDAATRVIARLIKERDEARALLADRNAAVAAGGGENPPAAAPRDTAGGTGPANGAAPDAMEVVRVTNSVDASAAADEKAVGVDGGGGASDVRIPENVLSRIKGKHEEMTTMRMARKSSKSPTLATSGDVREYVQTHSVQALPAEARGLGGPSHCAVQMVASAGGGDGAADEAVAVGCGDGAIRMYAAADLAIAGVGAEGAHAGGVTCLAHDAAVHPALLFSGGADGTVRAWSNAALQAASLPSRSGRAEGRDGADGIAASGGAKGRSSRRRRSSSVSAAQDPVVPAVELEGEAGSPTSPVTGLSVHPCAGLVLSSLESGRWRLHDTEAGELIGAGSAARGAVGSDCCTLHPDGAIFAIGLASGAVEMWDVNRMPTSSGCVETLGAGVASPGGARAVCMSENGYYMVVAGGGVVRVWDLRALKMTRESRIEDGESAGASCGIALDWSGSFCAATTGGGAVRLFETRKLKRLGDAGVRGAADSRTDGRVGMCWGTDARSAFASCGGGGLIRIGAKLPDEEGAA